MKKRTVSMLILLSALFCTGCTEQEIIDNTAALLSEASVLMEEEEFSESEASLMEEEQSPAEETSLAAEEEQALQEEEESLWEEAGAEAVSVESEDPEYSEAEETFDTEVTIAEDGVYTSKEDVSLYIHIYERLPDNFMTKKEAQALGWEGGSLEPYAPGMCIGGNRFGNYEGLLPEEDGRTYTECDIDTLGASSRGAKRIVFSNDGLIYYTEDHYETFELLYGEE